MSLRSTDARSQTDTVERPGASSSTHPQPAPNQNWLGACVRVIHVWTLGTSTDEVSLGRQRLLLVLVPPSLFITVKVLEFFQVTATFLEYYVVLVSALLFWRGLHVRRVRWILQVAKEAKAPTPNMQNGRAGWWALHMSWYFSLLMLCNCVTTLCCEDSLSFRFQIGAITLLFFATTLYPLFLDIPVPNSRSGFTWRSALEDLLGDSYAKISPRLGRLWMFSSIMYLFLVLGISHCLVDWDYVALSMFFAPGVTIGAVTRTDAVCSLCPLDQFRARFLKGGDNNLWYVMVGVEISLAVLTIVSEVCEHVFGEKDKAAYITKARG